MPRASFAPCRHLPALLTALPLLMLGACGGPPPAPDTGAPAGYEALRERIAPEDFGPLAGRHILLDPGHGGFFRGAVADNGLTEADINLDVALQLRGLLEWAGARVAMTRTADRDFLAGTDSTVAADLAFRVSLADSLQPDVFLSLHHNSNATRDPLLNETQTYYPLGDDGASLDLARAIHRHLAINLDIRPARLLPGNFHVLRNSPVPAVLGEPAMISHPGVAEKLTLAGARRLEAEAYFLGLLEYFAAGDPGWTPGQADTLTVGPTGADLAWYFIPSRAGVAAAPGPDPASCVLTVDGRRVWPHVDATGHEVRWQAPAPDDGRPLRVALRGRNLAGRSLPVAHTLLMPAAGRRLQVQATGDSTGHALVSWRTAGAWPLPEGRLVWPDGRSCRVSAATPADTLMAAGFPGPPVFTPLVHGPDSVTVAWHAAPLAEGWVWRSAGDSPPVHRWRARMLPGGAAPPPVGRTAVPMAGPAAWWSTPGRRPLLTPPPTADPAYLAPVMPRLEGRVVVIDPAGSGSDPDGTGPTGVTGHAVNAGTARELASLLEALGATAVLTDTRDPAGGPVAKVALAGRVGADLFITVGRGPASVPPRVLHHPGSRLGGPWAASTATALTAFLPDTAVSVASWNYLLRHTACPALEVRLPHAATPADEVRLESRGWQAAEARALLLGLARALEATRPLAAVAVEDLLPFLPGAPPIDAVDWVLWDGELPWYPWSAAGTTVTDSLSSWREPGLPARGPVHTLEIHAGTAWQLWMVRTDAAPITGNLILNGDRKESTTPTP